MRPNWVSGEGDHKGRPYNICVGASDPARKVHELGQDNSMFALRSEDQFNLHQSPQPANGPINSRIPF